MNGGEGETRARRMGGKEEEGRGEEGKEERRGRQRVRDGVGGEGRKLEGGFGT